MIFKIALSAFLGFSALGIIIFFVYDRTNPMAPPTDFSKMASDFMKKFEKEKKIDIRATFVIYTNGVKRSFNSSMYHMRSDYVYLTAENPSIVHVSKNGITWGIFFKTLPLTLDESCLITGDGATFCDAEESSLKFFLNKKLDPGFLEKEIREGDRLLISFGPGNENVEAQLKQLYQIQIR